MSRVASGKRKVEDSSDDVVSGAAASVAPSHPDPPARGNTLEDAIELSDDEDGVELAAQQQKILQTQLEEDQDEVMAERLKLEEDQEVLVAEREKFKKIKDDFEAERKKVNELQKILEAKQRVFEATKNAFEAEKKEFEANQEVLLRDRKALEAKLDAFKEEQDRLALCKLPSVSNVYTERELATDSPEFRKIKSMIDTSRAGHIHPQAKAFANPPEIEEVRIFAICNPSLLREYLGAKQSAVSRGISSDSVSATNASPIAKFTKQQCPRNVEVADHFDVTGVRTDEDANCFILFHGTKPECVSNIKHGGFEPTMIPRPTSGELFGGGIYLTNMFSKADCYTKPDANGVHHMFLARACLGEVHVTTAALADKETPRRRDGKGFVDTVIAEVLSSKSGLGQGCVYYPEVVLKRPRNAMPQYLIQYKHMAGCSCTHCRT